jgi:glycosyltransferase involved in cell wall biosynthesis
MTTSSVQPSVSGTQGLRYVLITPARNEAVLIEQTIQSVVSQTVLPLKWIIVSDGSTDGTDEIVRRYAASHPWIELFSLPERKERHFAGKAHAFNAGFVRVKDSDFEIIGNLDADITFEEDYFRYLLSKFTEDPALGVAGTPFREGTVQYDYRFTRKEHVSGACQMFRRACFEEVGGYTPIKGGGVDLVAVITARMRGWKTQTFTDKVCLHHRPISSATHHPLTIEFKDGYYDYPLGVHPLYKMVSSVYRMRKRPIILSGASHLAGYLWAMLKRPNRPVSAEFVQFRRREQMRWLGEYLRRMLRVLNPYSR